MTETPTQTEARAMHTAYVHATGLALPMDMARERAWVELLNRGFGPDDVRQVAAFIRRGIARARAGKPNPRNEGALRFRNFTALDQFEEDHAGAQLERAKYFTPAPAARAPSPPPLTTSERATPEDVRAALSALRRNGQALAQPGRKETP